MDMDIRQGHRHCIDIEMDIWIVGYRQWTANSDYPLRQPTELELDPGGRH